jgi:rhodanese-related sulfurtransferase
MTFIAAHWHMSLLFFILLVSFLGLEMRDRVAGLPRLSSSAVTHLMNNESGTILDIREKANFEKGHILGAKHLGNTDIEKRLTQLKVNKQNPVIVVCENGSSALKTATLLRKMGFEKACSLKGGLTTWRSDGLPLTK